MYFQVSIKLLTILKQASLFNRDLRILESSYCSFFLDYQIMKVYTPNQDFHLRIIMLKRNTNVKKIFFVAISAVVLIPFVCSKIKKLIWCVETRKIVNSRFIFYFVLRLCNIELFAPRFKKVVNYHCLARGLFLIYFYRAWMKWNLLENAVLKP